MKKKPPEPKPADSDEDDTVREGAPSDEVWPELGSTRVIGNDGASGKDPTVHEEDTAIVSPEKDPGVSILGDFELLQKIGEGAMGAVYRARQLSFNREVALKVLFPHVASNPKLVERLYREGRVMGLLEHENIVQAYGVDEDKGHHFVAMEFVDGESLQKWLNRLGRIDLPDALHITLTVARALAYAHGQGLVHRDIKPDNILITRRGVIKVADLGMVKTADEDMQLTQTGHAVGTPWYMPLEQARNAKETDGRSDIYALGCVLYCMLTGNPPFTGRTIVEVIQAKEQGTFPLARSTNPDVPERLDLVIIKMTAKSSRYRYQNCEELIRDLESLNLASDKLGFLHGKPTRRAAKEPAGKPGSSTVDVDPDVWFVNITHADGGSTLSRFSTSQVRKLLEEGALNPAAKASHLASEGFRALATYKEFQGSALSRMSKKAADAQGARFRNLMKKIEEQDRDREEREKPKIPVQSPAVESLSRYWQTFWRPSLYVAGGLLLLFLIWYVATGLGR